MVWHYRRTYGQTDGVSQYPHFFFEKRWDNYKNCCDPAHFFFIWFSIDKVVESMKNIKMKLLKRLLFPWSVTICLMRSIDYPDPRII